MRSRKELDKKKPKHVTLSDFHVVASSATLDHEDDTIAYARINIMSLFVDTISTQNSLVTGIKWPFLEDTSGGV
jgi:hypothetical protein